MCYSMDCSRNIVTTNAEDGSGIGAAIIAGALKMIQSILGGWGFKTTAF